MAFAQGHQGFQVGLGGAHRRRAGGSSDAGAEAALNVSLAGQTLYQAGAAAVAVYDRRGRPDAVPGSRHYGVRRSTSGRPSRAWQMQVTSTMYELRLRHGAAARAGSSRERGLDGARRRSRRYPRSRQSAGHRSPAWRRAAAHRCQADRRRAIDWKCRSRVLLRRNGRLRHSRRPERQSTRPALDGRATALKRFDDGDAAYRRLGERGGQFTESDFGRTLTSNGDGTDHGLGRHSGRHRRRGRRGPNLRRIPAAAASARALPRVTARTTSAPGGSFRRFRRTSTPPRWRAGSASRRRICKRSSHAASTTSPYGIWVSWPDRRAAIIPEPAQFATSPRARRPADFAHAHQGLAAGRAASRKAAGARVGRAVRGRAPRDLAAPRHERHECARPRPIAARPFRLAARAADGRAPRALQPVGRGSCALGGAAGRARDRAAPPPGTTPGGTGAREPSRRPRLPDRAPAGPRARGVLLPVPRQPVTGSRPARSSFAAPWTAPASIPARS